MALRITHECINCGACEPECPNEAIDIGVEIFAIEAELCTECEGIHDAPQCVAVCPVECVEPDPDRPQRASCATRPQPG